jgi:hypothetical protein
VAGAQDAHVNGLVPAAAQLAHAALLQGAQQLDLHGQRQVGDFVEQQAAAVAAWNRPSRSCRAPV